MSARSHRAAPRRRLVAGLGLAAASLTACSLPTLDVLPAPNPVSGPTYRLEATFRDALNLTVGAKVKDNGVVVGQVTSISTHDYRALVRMRITTRVQLHTGTTAQVRFTSPLGEDYVALTQPDHPGAAILHDGASLPEASTSSAPSIEDTFAALSLLLNGGGLDQLSVVVNEINKALHGRTGPARDIVEQLDSVVRTLDGRKADIDRGLAALSRLATELAGERATIGAALETFPPAVQLLADQVHRLDDLVVRVGRLGTHVKTVLDRGQAALLNDLDELRPSLDALVGAQASFPATMESLVRFGQLIDRATPGDYLNAVATIDVLFDVDAVPLPTIPPSSGTAAMQSLLGAATR